MDPNPSAHRTTFSYPIDECMKPLHIPLKFKPYMEKHRIAELFADITKLLITKKPKDVLGFLRDHLGVNQDSFVPQIIFLGPPTLNKLTLAYYVCQFVNCVPITLKDIYVKKNRKQMKSESLWPTSPPQSLNLAEDETGTTQFDISKSVDENICTRLKFRPSIFSLSPRMSMTSFQQQSNEIPVKNNYQFLSEEPILEDCEELALSLLELLKENRFFRRGWIFVDFPRNKKEADCLFRHQVIPTHVISFQFDPQSDIKTDLWDPRTTQCDTSMGDFQLTMLQLKQVYSHFHRELHTLDKNIAEMGENIVSMIRAPILAFVKVKLRVVIIGTRGSGRQSLGNRLAENLKIIHVNMTRRNTVDAASLVSRLLEQDCLDQGYVLTGFPRDVDGLKRLDQCDNPPNRTMFLAGSKGVCLQQLKDSYININTGKPTRDTEVVDHNHSQCISKRRMASKHPEDEETNFATLRAYTYEAKRMIKYCGGSAIVIDATCNLDTLYERIVKAIQSPTQVFRDTDCESLSSYSADSTKSEMGMTRTAQIIDHSKEKFMFHFQCNEANQDDNFFFEKLKHILKTQ